MNQIRKGTILLLCMSSLLNLVMAQQTAIDFENLRTVIPLEHKETPSYQTLAAGNTNELKWAASKLFLGYKTFVSSQDGNRCSFHPSCSEYSIQVVREKGIIVGGLMTCDRLIRCNGLSPELYQVDRKRRVLIDYPE